MVFKVPSKQAAKSAAFVSNALVSGDRLCSHSHRFPSFLREAPVLTARFLFSQLLCAFPVLWLQEGRHHVNTRRGQESFPGLALKATHLPGVQGAPTTHKPPGTVLQSKL